jgi:Flp pilus assembly protein TadG
MASMAQTLFVRRWISAARAMTGWSHARKALARFVGDRSGAAAVTLALTFSLLVGFAALATEVADWYKTKRTMQGAADSGAYSAATARWSGASTDAYTSEARSVAGNYHYIDGTNGVTVTVNNPPASGNYTADPNAIEVIIARPQPLKLASMFMSTGPTIQARAVATTNPNGSGCVLALDRGDVTDVTDNGNTTLNLNHCNLYINSPSRSALSLVGGATINADSAFISGNYTTTGHASLNTTHGTFTGAAPANDPYADVPIPSYSGCNQNNYSLSGNQSQTFSPGSSGTMVFCNGFRLSGGSSVTLQPGTYIIDGGSFSVSGNSSISGSGVTIILTSSNGSGYATASISGGSIVNLTAPTAGPLAGLAFFQDRNAPQSGTDSFTGGTTQNINGTLYFPNQNVTFNGGTSTGGAICTQLVALTITFNGNAAFNNNCLGKGVRGIGTSFVKLVE